MIGFVPNIYVKQYLSATDQLNAELDAKLQKYMESGEYDFSPIHTRPELTKQIRVEMRGNSSAQFGPNVNSGPVQIGFNSLLLSNYCHR